MLINEVRELSGLKPLNEGKKKIDESRISKEFKNSISESKLFFNSKLSEIKDDKLKSLIKSDLSKIKNIKTAGDIKSLPKNLKSLAYVKEVSGGDKFIGVVIGILATAIVGAPGLLVSQVPGLNVVYTVLVAPAWLEFLKYLNAKHFNNMIASKTYIGLAQAIVTLTGAGGGALGGMLLADIEAEGQEEMKILLGILGGIAGGIGGYLMGKAVLWFDKLTIRNLEKTKEEDGDLKEALSNNIKFKTLISILSIIPVIGWVFMAISGFKFRDEFGLKKTKEKLKNLVGM
jgi:hypothetical protein